MKLFAVFLILETEDGLFWGVTRPNEPGKGSGVAFPGGKVDKSESPERAVIRESMEEGIGFRYTDVELVLVHKSVVEGRLVGWFCQKALKDRPELLDMGAYALSEYKEKHRGIVPVLADRHQFVGFGNEDAIRAYDAYRAEEMIRMLKKDNLY